MGPWVVSTSSQAMVDMGKSIDCEPKKGESWGIVQKMQGNKSRPGPGPGPGP